MTAASLDSYSLLYAYLIIYLKIRTQVGERVKAFSDPLG